MWTTIAFVASLSVLAMLWIKISNKIARFRRIRRVLRKRNRHYRAKEAAFIAVCLLLFISLPLLAYLDETNQTFDFSLLAHSVDDEAEPLEGAVRPVPASEVTAETASIKDIVGEGAMSCPVGRGLVLVRRVITPADATQIPHIVAAALETDSGTLLECQDDQENITSCDGYRNYKFDFYAYVALREIGTTEEVIECAPYDHFEATTLFRSYIAFREYDAKAKWPQ